VAVPYYTYILASRTKTLYIGVTNDIERRVSEHRAGIFGSFTGRYNVNRLVYYGDYDDVTDAIYREKQLKGWVRSKKIELIESLNPEWDDLSEDWPTMLGDPSLRSG
jgi:putative endonuclease